MIFEEERRRMQYMQHMRELREIMPNIHGNGGMMIVGNSNNNMNNNNYEQMEMGMQMGMQMEDDVNDNDNDDNRSDGTDSMLENFYDRTLTLESAMLKPVRTKKKYGGYHQQTSSSAEMAEGDLDIGLYNKLYYETNTNTT